MSADLSQHFPQVGTFLEAIEPLLPAYRYGLLSYVAVVHEGAVVILRAGVRFSMDDALPRRINQPLSLRAGQKCFEKLQLNRQSIDTWIRAVVAGDALPCEEPQLKLLPDSTRRFSAYHESTLPTFLLPVEESELLRISGIGRELIAGRQKALDRELHEIGFDTLEQLMRTFGLKPSGETVFEISVAPVAKIDPASYLRGSELQLIVRLAMGLEREKLRVTVRDADASCAPLPHSFGSAQIAWSEEDGYWVGSLGVDLGANAVVICRAVYAGRIQHEVRLADLHALPNPRRMVLNILDRGFERIQELLVRPTGNRREDFETAVGLLFQMLGFPPAAIGKLSQMQDEPDFFLEGADREILVVECSTDVPPDKKLVNLVSRTQRVRDELSRLHAPPIVLPMLVVPVLPAELDPIREKADTYGVIIVCLPDINAAIERTLFAPNAREVLREWRAAPLMRIFTQGLDGRQ